MVFFFRLSVSSVCLCLCLRHFCPDVTVKNVLIGLHNACRVFQKRGEDDHL